MKRILLFFLISFSCANSEEPFPVTNPVTDICWGCLLPIHVEGHNITPKHQDFVTYKKRDLLDWLPCFCWPKTLGIRIAFWEPTMFVEVARTPYRSFFYKGNSTSYKRRGSGAISGGNDAARSSFYNVHIYYIPYLHLLGFLPGFTCFKNTDSVPYAFFSEWFPFWNDSESSWHAVLDPERHLFSTPEAYFACREDCKSSSSFQPKDKLWWCAGCLGSLFPYCGYIGHHVGGIQASSLLVCRMLALTHAFGGNTKAVEEAMDQWLPGTAEPVSKLLKHLPFGKGFKKDEYCKKTWYPRLKKTIYKTQLVYPKAESKTRCHPLGEDIQWASGDCYPNGGEDFVYVVWTKMHCCLDAMDVILKIFGDLGLADAMDEITKIFEAAKEKNL